MSVIYSQGGNSFLGTLGNLAQTAGTFIPGAQWLKPAGMVISGVGSIANGQPQNTIAQILSGILKNNMEKQSIEKLFTGDDTNTLNFIRKYRALRG